MRKKLNLASMAMLICLGLLFTSSAIAFDEVKMKKFKHCHQEAGKQGIKGKELSAFMKACVNKAVDASADNQKTEEASLPPSGFRGGDFLCGGAKVEFKFYESAIEKDGVETVMTISRGERSTILRYDMGISFIGGTCVLNSFKEPTIVFQAYCGGSGCHDLDNWGIIDAKSLLLRLVPNDWNRKDARRILGRDFPKIEMISISDKAERLNH